MNEREAPLDAWLQLGRDLQSPTIEGAGRIRAIGDSLFAGMEKEDLLAAEVRGLAVTASSVAPVLMRLPFSSGTRLLFVDVSRLRAPGSGGAG